MQIKTHKAIVKPLGILTGHGKSRLRSLNIPMDVYVNVGTTREDVLSAISEFVKDNVLMIYEPFDSPDDPGVSITSIEHPEWEQMMSKEEIDKAYAGLSREYSKERALYLENKIHCFNWDEIHCFKGERVHVSDVISAAHDVIGGIENKMAAFDVLMELARHFAIGLEMTKGEFTEEVEWFVDGYPSGGKMNKEDEGSEKEKLDITIDEQHAKALVEKLSREQDEEEERLDAEDFVEALKAKLDAYNASHALNKPQYNVIERMVLAKLSGQVIGMIHAFRDSHSVLEEKNIVRELILNLLNSLNEPYQTAVYVEEALSLVRDVNSMSCSKRFCKMEFRNSLARFEGNYSLEELENIGNIIIKEKTNERDR